MTAIRNSLVFTIALLLITTSLAAAHAELVRSIPAADEHLSEAPTQVMVWFDEELDTRNSTVRVVNASGQQVDRGDGYVDLYDPDHASLIVRLPAVPDGAYTVHWRATTIDDDGVIEGSFAFSVGEVKPVAAPRLLPSWFGPASGAAAALVIIAVVFAVRVRRRHTETG